MNLDEEEKAAMRMPTISWVLVVIVAGLTLSELLTPDPIFEYIQALIEGILNH